MAGNQRLNATITIGAALSASLRRNLGLVSNGLDRVGNEIAEITRRQRELDGQRRVLERQGQSVEALDREYQDLNQTLERLRDRQSRLQNVSTGIANVGSAARTAFTEVGNLIRNVGILGGLAGGALFMLAKETADYGDEVGAVAARIGITTDALQELHFAAEQSDVSTEALNGALETFTKNIGLAQRGLGRARPALEALGLSADDLGRMLPEQQLIAVAEAMRNVETQTERVSIAAQLFGDAGADLLPMLDQGAAGINAMREEARALGLVLSEQAVADAGEFDNALRRVQFGLRGLRHTVGAELLPVFNELFAEFTTYLVENRAQIQQWARDFGSLLKQAVPVLIDIGEGLVKVGAAVADVTAQVADMIGGWENLGIVVGTLFAAPAIVAIGKVVTSLGSLIAALVAIASWPVLIGAAMVAAGALIIWQWDRVKEFLSGVWQGFKDGAQAAVTWVVDQFKWLGDQVMSILQPIRDFWNSLPSLSDITGGGGFTGFTAPPGVPGMSLPGIPERAVGGAFNAGPVLVGEQGPELRFENRAGYIATAQQTRDLLRSGGGGRTINVGGITINGVTDPRAVAAEVMRALREAERGALYDGAMP